MNQINDNKLNQNENWLFDQAIKARDQDNTDEAEALLKKILATKPNSAATNIVLAGIYFNVENYTLSAQYFETAVKHSPKSKIASLGYFQSLWELGRIRDSLKEIERFLSISYVENYDEIIRDLMLRPDMDAFKNNRELIEQLHQKICDFHIGGEKGKVSSK